MLVEILTNLNKPDKKILTNLEKNRTKTNVFDMPMTGDIVFIKISKRVGSKESPKYSDSE